MSKLTLYFILMLDRLEIMVFIGVFLSIGLFILLAPDNPGGMNEKLSDWPTPAMRRSLVAAIIFLLIGITIPTTKQALLIWGIPTLVEAVQKNDKALQIPDKLLTYINQELDERIKK